MVYSTPSIICAVWVFFMQESPKFLFTKGREIEAVNVLKKIYQLNNLSTKEEFEVSLTVVHNNIFKWN